MKNFSIVNWQGNFKEGTGYIHSGRDAYNLDYNYTGRVAEARTTNPEELISSAHAACFAMALRFGLEKAQIDVDQIEVRCEVTAVDLKVKGSHLFATIDTKASHPQIEEIAEEAKKNCPISQLLNCPISLDVNFSQVGQSANYS